MKTKLIVMALVMALVMAGFLSSLTQAHEGHDHGSSDTGAGRYGGLVTTVVETKNKASLYKAELVRSEDGTVRIYLYDASMKPLSLQDFEKSTKADLITVKSGKETIVSFPLALEGKTFTGKAPKAAAKPYTLNVAFKTKDKELLAIFDHLD